MLRVDAVSKTFGGVKALRGASLTCAAREIVGLIGPNGAGKSTLVNAISGVITPDEGRIELKGSSLAGRGPEYCARAGVARTFQNIRLFRDLTVRQNVEVAHISCEAVRPEVAARIDIDKLLEDYQLETVSDAPAGTLPYGSQRRLEIARALALGPDLLLLDEPAAGLNDEESEVLAAAIERIRSDVGCATIVIDHDLRFINRICERLCVMDQGEVIVSGSAKDVWSDPRVIEVYVGQSRPS